MKKILFYQFGSLSEPGLEEIFKQNNVEYCVFAKKMKDYHADAEFAMEFLQVLHGKQVQAVFSFDYFPLAADAGRLENVLHTETAEIRNKYSCDISFIGNLYNEKKNRLRNVNLTEYTKGYLEGIIEAQLKVYGYNFIKETW